ncbi:MAG: M23 family metallopeptidase [Thermodesulfobacteriota bacterium]
MSHKITFFMLSTNGSPVRQFTISKFFIAFMVLVIGGVCGVVGYGFQEYRVLKQKNLVNIDLRRTIDSQNETVEVQRRQIQKFAEDINSLKSKLTALNGFEKQIRIIANLDHLDIQEGLFGIGGSMPEDIDPKLELTEKHNSLMREMHGQIDQINEAAVIQEDGFQALIDELENKKNLLASTPAIRPSKGLYTSIFGRRKSPFTGLNEFHKGLDIASAEGTPVLATADGTVTYADVKGNYGNMLVIDHGHGMVTRYAHLKEFLKAPGEKVKRGEKIALMGNTGRSTGPHVHYEVRFNGVPVDPQKYILN